MCGTCEYHYRTAKDEPCASCREGSNWRALGYLNTIVSPDVPVVAPVAPWKCEKCGWYWDAGFPCQRCADTATDYHAAKRDAGKLRWDCLPWSAVEQVVAVLTFGAEKYAAWSWPAVPDARARYFAAAQRHLAAWLRGEREDAESGLPHLAHAACDVLFLLAFDLGAAAPPVAFGKPEDK
jgi:hypothetical protein